MNTKIQRLTQVAAAVIACVSLPATAAIVTSGQVSPDPSSGNVTGNLNVGNTGLGSLTVNGGSALQAQRLTLGTATTGNGSVTVTGAGSSITTDYGVVGNFFNTNIGSQGIGSLSVLAGGSFVNGLNDANCQSRCVLKISNGTGSQGNLLVDGAGSALTTVGQVQVGWGSRFTQAVAGFDYGVAGGAAVGRATVSGGAQVTSRSLIIGRLDTASELTGAETASGQVVVEGPGSLWTQVRNAALSGAAALLNLAGSNNSSGSLTLRNGGVMRLDGSQAATQLSGINVGTAAGGDATNSSGSITVRGAGSRLEFTGGNGFLNLGRGIGSVAQMTIDQGGVVTGTTPQAFGFVSVGRGGADGTLSIDGANSLMRLSGGDAVGGGAFLHVGRFDVVAGTGAVNVRNGARLEIDDRTQVLTSTNQTGMIVGNAAGSVGTMTISGPGSVVQIAGSTGKTPYVGVGRDGGTGSLTISNGGRLEMSSEHVSLPSPPNTNVYSAGEALFLTIGQRFTGNDGLPSVGTVTVTGAGSAIAMTGAADRIVQVGSTGGQGTLNINQGGRVQSTAVLVGNGEGAVGNLNMNGGVLVIDGQRNGGPNPIPGGAGLGIGRGDGGIGSAVITNGSRITIDTTGVDGGISVGGSSIAPGGTGSMVVSGGSTVSVNGPSVSVTVGSQGTNTTPGAGTLSLLGAGTSMTVTGANARVLAGNFVGSTGVINVGTGATLSTSGLVGIAHNGTAASGGTGLLINNGTVNASTLFLAPGGVLMGNGTVNANVINQGGIRVGNSPGRMLFNGAFDSSQGQIVLEVQQGPAGFEVDELVFGDPSLVTMGGADIVFSFLGDTDPLAFLNSGLFDLSSFFLGSDGRGGTQPLDGSFRNWFAQSNFSAQADRYTISNFRFDAVGGASFDATLIPEPGSWALVMLALAACTLQLRLRANRAKRTGA